MLEHAKVFLSKPNIISEKSEAMNSQPRLEHAKIVWLIRTFSEKSEALNSHPMLEYPKVFEQSWWEIRGIGLTSYVETYRICLSNWDILWEITGTGLTSYIERCKHFLSNHNTSFERSQALDSHPMLEHAEIVEQLGDPFWEIRGIGLTSYVGICKDFFENSGHPFWEMRSTRLTCYIGTWKDWLTDQNIFSQKWKALDLHAMLKYAKVISSNQDILSENPKALN